MALCAVEKLSLSFGKKVIFADATFAIEANERVGLIGPNGSGKSTLLRIVAGQRESDAGRVSLVRGTQVGYLPQDITELPPGTLLESVMSMVPGRDALERGVEHAEGSLAEAADGDASHLARVQRFTDAHEQLATFEDRYGKHRAESLLGGLGFSVRDLSRPVTEFSGGWRMRALLSGLLLCDPDLLLLDEPTNHLDMPSLMWFDKFLEREQKALLLVCHDRDFLNRQISRVLSLEPEGLRDYKGNYDAYVTQRAEEERLLEARARKLSAERDQTEKFIERFRYKASKAKQVQSRIKKLEKQETITLLTDHAEIRFRFPEAARSGKEPVHIKGVGKRFGDLVVYQRVNEVVRRGDRIAIIGKNGAGKTTLLKLIANELAPDGGVIELGHNTTLSYYAQHHTEKLDLSRTVLQQVWDLVPTQSQSFVRGVLGAFLFQGDDVDKLIAVLSGGERARVALARLLVLPSNVMLMDEPTNHLDIASSEKLIHALERYTGTLLFVSHNRSFIKQVATRIWDVRDGGVVDWPGDLDSYLYHVEQQEKAREAGARAPKVVPDNGAAASAGAARNRRQERAKDREKRASAIKPARGRVARAEQRISALESEKKRIEAELGDPAVYADKKRAAELGVRFQEVAHELEALYPEWEAATARLAEIESELEVAGEMP